MGIKPKSNESFVNPRGTGGNILADVFVKMTNPVPDDCNFKLNVYAVPNTGGHGHSGGIRPKGSIGMINSTALKIISGENIGSVLFTSGSVAETERIKVQMQYNGADVKEPKEAEIEVKVKGLMPLYLQSYFRLTGDTGKTSVGACPGHTIEHSENHYATPKTIDRIKIIADKYYAKSGGYRLGINDMSLIWGGRFDICGNWKNPHSLSYGHPTGLGVDFDSMAMNFGWQTKPVNMIWLEKIAAENEGKRVMEEPIHFIFPP